MNHVLSVGRGLLCWAMEQVTILPLVGIAPLLVFSEYFPARAVQAGAVLLALYAAAAFVRHAGPLRLPLSILCIPLLLTAGVSVWASADRAASLPKLYLLLLGLATLILFATTRSEKAGAWPWVWTYLGGTTLLGLVGPFVTEFRWTNKFFNLRDLKLSFLHTGEVLDINILGCLLAVALPLSVALLLEGRRRPGRLWIVCAVVICLLLGVILVLTQSRAAILGAAAGCLVVAAWLWKPARLVLLAAVPLGVLGIFLIGPEGPAEVISQAQGFRTLEARLELWNRSVYAIQDFPFTGIGLGMFGKVIPLLYPLFLFAPDQNLPHAHHLYLQVALDLGIPGLVGFIALHGFLASRGVSALREDRGPRLLIVGLLGSLTVFLVNGLLDSPLWLNKPHAVPFLLLGLLAAVAGSGRSGSSSVPDGTRSNWRLAGQGGLVLLLWVLVSLAAISLVGDYPYWSLAVAVAGGTYLGWEGSRL